MSGAIVRSSVRSLKCQNVRTLCETSNKLNVRQMCLTDNENSREQLGKIVYQNNVLFKQLNDVVNQNNVLFKQLNEVIKQNNTMAIQNDDTYEESDLSNLWISLSFTLKIIVFGVAVAYPFD